jgi:hypothetical protein
MACHRQHRVYSLEKVLTMYSAEWRNGEWRYSGIETVPIDESAEFQTLYCQDCDEEFEGSVS